MMQKGNAQQRGVLPGVQQCVGNVHYLQGEHRAVAGSLCSPAPAGSLLPWLARLCSTACSTQPAEEELMMAFKPITALAPEHFEGWMTLILQI